MKYKDDLYYHLYNRGVHSEKIFFTNSNYEYFMRLVKTNSKKHHVELEAYCLMPNHYHFLIRQKTNGNISKFIQSTMTSYVQAINIKYGLSGTLFQGKAKAKLIDSDEYAVQITRYIHLNPVHAKIVDKPENWKYSDYLDWIGNNRLSTNDLELRDRHFDTGEEYRLFVESYIANEDSNENDRLPFKVDKFDIFN